MMIPKGLASSFSDTESARSAYQSMPLVKVLSSQSKRLSPICGGNIHVAWNHQRFFMVISCLAASRDSFPDGDADALKLGSTAKQSSTKADLEIAFMFDSHMY